MGSYRQLLGMQTPPDRPQAIPPVPEEYEGTSFPYRGIENHGVEPTPGVDPELYYDRNSYDMDPDKFNTIPAEKEPDPVPVRIVNESARERFHFRVGTITIPTTSDALELCGRNDNRSLIRIRVPGSSPGSIVFGSTRSLSAGTVYTLAAGQEIEFRTTEPIFVNASNPAQAPVFMFIETYTLGL